MPQRWIGCLGQDDVALMHWPPRHRDLTPYNFFLWGFVKDNVFLPPVSANLQELCDRITAAVSLIDHDMLTHVWNELDYEMSAVSVKVDTLSICDV